MKNEYKQMYLLHSKLNKFKNLEYNTLNLIEGFLKWSERPYVAFSGGKDSTVLTHLVSRIDKNIKIFTESNDLDFEKENFCKNFINFCELTNYDFRVTRESVLSQMKEDKNFWYDTVIEFIKDYNPDSFLMGIRAEENQKTRGILVRTKGLVYSYKDNYANRKKWCSNLTVCIPLGYWEGLDIFSYIMKYKLPYHEVYDKDGFCKPHEIRFGGKLLPDNMDESNFTKINHKSWLKYYYPDMYNKLRYVYNNLNVGV